MEFLYTLYQAPSSSSLANKNPVSFSILLFSISFRASKKSRAFFYGIAAFEMGLCSTTTELKLAAAVHTTAMLLCWPFSTLKCMLERRQKLAFITILSSTTVVVATLFSVRPSIRRPSFLFEWSFSNSKMCTVISE